MSSLAKGKGRCWAHLVVWFGQGRQGLPCALVQTAQGAWALSQQACHSTTFTEDASATVAMPRLCVSAAWVHQALRCGKGIGLREATKCMRRSGGGILPRHKHVHSTLPVGQPTCAAPVRKHAQVWAVCGEHRPLRLHCRDSGCWRVWPPASSSGRGLCRARVCLWVLYKQSHLPLLCGWWDVLCGWFGQ